MFDDTALIAAIERHPEGATAELILMSIVSERLDQLAQDGKIEQYEGPNWTETRYRPRT